MSEGSTVPFLFFYLLGSAEVDINMHTNNNGFYCAVYLFRPYFTMPMIVGLPGYALGYFVCSPYVFIVSTVLC